MERDVTIPGRTIKRVVQVLLALLALAALVGLVMWIAQMGGKEAEGTVPAKVKKSRYQSVLLSDGRLLIGKVRNGDAHYLQLRDTYFIQESQEPASDKKPAQPTREVKSISEQLQGPERNMLVSREHVVSIENLREDSQAVRAIEQIGSGPDN